MTAWEREVSLGKQRQSADPVYCARIHRSALGDYPRPDEPCCTTCALCLKRRADELTAEAERLGMYEKKETP